MQTTALPQGRFWTGKLALGQRQRKRMASLFGSLTLIILGAAFAIPLLWMISSSLKTDADIFRLPVSLLPREWRLANYPDALRAIRFGLYMRNTLMYSLSATLGAVASNLFISYAFARLRWRGRDIAFYFVIATMMLPAQVTLIPIYVLYSRIGWLNTLLPLIVPSFFGNAYYIFLMRQFMRTLPSELDDTARIDGCNELGIFRRIVLPLVKPAMTAIAVFHLLHTWNDFLGPLIFVGNPEWYTLSIGLRMYFTMHGAEWGLLMAAATMFTLPILLFFFFAQRTFIEGIALTGIKG